MRYSEEFEYAPRNIKNKPHKYPTMLQRLQYLFCIFR